MRWVLRILAAAMLAALVAAPSSAQPQGRRVALVIGNSAYAAQGTLANPGPDSRLVADALRRVGFVVTAQTDLGKQGMERALRDFSRAADGAEVALVYYAGHGLEANGVNWLLPVDAQLADERDLSFEAISLDTVLATVERARGLRMVVLDACRNNPFARSMRRSATTRATVTRGLADVEVTGTLVLYAARGGTVAQDGAPGRNSPFAAAFARRVPEPGVGIRLLVSKVRDDVLAATNRAQEPFSYGSLPGVEMALTGEVVSSTSPPAPVPTPHSPAVSARLRTLEKLDIEVLQAAARDENGEAVWAVARRRVDSGAPYSRESDLGLIVSTLTGGVRDTAIEHLVQKAMRDNNLETVDAWQFDYASDPVRRLELLRWSASAWIGSRDSAVKNRLTVMVSVHADRCINGGLRGRSATSAEVGECSYYGALIGTSSLLESAELMDFLGPPYRLPPGLSDVCRTLMATSGTEWKDQYLSQIRDVRRQVRKYAPECAPE